MTDPHKPAAPKPAIHDKPAAMDAKAPAIHGKHKPITKPKSQPVAAKMPRKPREPAPEHPGPVAAFLGGALGVALTVPLLAIEGVQRGHRWIRGRWRR